VESAVVGSSLNLGCCRSGHAVLDVGVYQRGDGVDVQAGSPVEDGAVAGPTVTGALANRVSVDSSVRAAIAAGRDVLLVAQRVWNTGDRGVGRGAVGAGWNRPAEARSGCHGQRVVLDKLSP
jgi:hypothetical protein